MFLTAKIFPVRNGSSSVAVGDFNGDSKLDLVTANHFDNNVSLLLGNGDGTFQAAVNYSLAYLTSLALGDFNGDGACDLVIGKRGYPLRPTWRGSAFGCAERKPSSQPFSAAEVRSIAVSSSSVS